MEPGGRTRWQTVASATVAQDRKSPADSRTRLPPVAAKSDGKEGVDGSSPSEGSGKYPQMALSCA
jgi:hypothetical protein